MVNMDFRDVMVLTRLSVHDNWKEIKKALKDHFEANYCRS